METPKESYFEIEAYSEERPFPEKLHLDFQICLVERRFSHVSQDDSGEDDDIPILTDRLHTNPKENLEDQGEKDDDEFTINPDYLCHKNRPNREENPELQDCPILMSKYPEDQESPISPPAMPRCNVELTCCHDMEPEQKDLQLREDPLLANRPGNNLSADDYLRLYKGQCCIGVQDMKPEQGELQLRYNPLLAAIHPKYEKTEIDGVNRRKGEGLPFTITSISHEEMMVPPQDRTPKPYVSKLLASRHPKGDNNKIDEFNRRRGKVSHASS